MDRCTYNGGKIMEFNEYQVAANRTLYGNEQVLTNCALGLAGESGQLIDLVKDYTFKGKELQIICSK